MPKYVGVASDPVGGAQKDFEEHNGISLNCLEQTISRNLDLEDAAPEGTKESEGHVIRRKGGLVLQ